MEKNRTSLETMDFELKEKNNEVFNGYNTLDKK